MPTFKPFIKHQKKDGSYHVTIRVTHNRKSSYLKTPFFVSASEVSKRKKNGKEELKIKNQAVLDNLDEIIVGYKKKILSVGMSIDSWDLDRVVKLLTSSTSTFFLDFIEYGKKYVESVKAEGRGGTAKKYDNAINALIRFLGRSTLDISEINYSFLKAFENHLRTEPVYRGTSKGEAKKTAEMKKGRALTSYMGHLKTIHEKAKDEYNDEDCGLINIPFSPFKKYQIPKMPEVEHRTLTIEQIQAIIDLPYKPHKRRGFSSYNLAKDVFLLSFGLMGINTADLHEMTAIDSDILAYNRRKTRSRRSDKAAMKVRIEPQIKPIIEKYIKDGELIFGKSYSMPISFNRIVNQGLKEIGKKIGVSNLTYYHARHSMASICANKLGIDIARVDEMLNHSDPKLSLARVYIEKDFKPLWEANKRLLELFDWSFYKKGE